MHVLSSRRALKQIVAAGLTVIVLVGAHRADAQSESELTAEKQKKKLIKLTLPPETELKTLIDLVSQRLGIQFLYDEQVANKRISINSPNPIPAETLLDVLKSALRMKGMALVDADAAGWKRIVMADDLPQIAVPQKGQTGEIVAGAAITQTFLLSHMQPDRIAKIIEPFLTKKGANVITLVDKNLLIVTDYAGNMQRISRLIELIDQAGPERMLQFQKVQNLDASELAQQITQTLVARGSNQPAGVPPVSVAPDKRTNQMVIVGTHTQIEEVLQLIRALDVALEQRTTVYPFQHVDAERIDRLMKETLDPVTSSQRYRSAVDKTDNLLIVTGSLAAHARLAQLKREMDVETKRTSSGVKFYRLRYADAQEVLNTLRAVEQRSGGVDDSSRRGVSPLGRGASGTSRGGGPQDASIDSVSGPNGADRPGTSGLNTPAQRDKLLGGLAPDVALASSSSSGMAGLGTIVPGAARVSVDQKTNSIIVIADRGVQQMYEELISALDRKRPQVMIEAKVVILDTSDEYAFGVEISPAGLKGAAQMLQFTSFGLSQVNAATGALSLNPGQGLNWSLVDPHSADAVIRCFANHRRAKILSAPRLLVGDNATGTLASVQEVPFTSVNASTTVATTSFAGFAEAGTTINVTPRIMDDDHLQLQFNVGLNSFTGNGSNGVPPPRQTDQITSKVTVPDGYTVIVGGLNSRSNSRSRNGLPFLELIPIIRDLTSHQSSSTNQTTLFVFLRPVILRDDKFRDLKYLSDQALPAASEPGNFPPNAPLLVK